MTRGIGSGACLAPEGKRGMGRELAVIGQVLFLLLLYYHAVLKYHPFFGIFIKNSLSFHTN